jgi:uncharacterized protein YkuJ
MTQVKIGSIAPQHRFSFEKDGDLVVVLSQGDKTTQAYELSEEGNEGDGQFFDSIDSNKLVWVR